MHIAGNEFQIYDWESLKPIASISARAEAPQLQIQGIPQPEPHRLVVHSAMTILSGPNTQLAVTYSTRLGQNTGRGSKGSKAVCFPTSALPPKTSEQLITALTESASICEVIDVIVGMYRELLIFLHVDGWICSMKAGAVGNSSGTGASKSEGVVQHFAPPLGWLRTSRELLIRVSRLGDVLFVVQGEVAVVKRGLDRAADIIR